MAKKKPALEELNAEIAKYETMEFTPQDDSFAEWRLTSQMKDINRRHIQDLKYKRDKLYPPSLLEVSTRLRAWRGQRGVREAAPELSDAIGCDVSLSTFSRIEGGHVGNIEPELLEKIERFLDESEK